MYVLPDHIVTVSIALTAVHGLQVAILGTSRTKLTHPKTVWQVLWL